MHDRILQDFWYFHKTQYFISLCHIFLNDFKKVRMQFWIFPDFNVFWSFHILLRSYAGDHALGPGGMRCQCVAKNALKGRSLGPECFHSGGQRYRRGCWPWCADQVESRDLNRADVVDFSCDGATEDNVSGGHQPKDVHTRQVVR